jgi:hypothetical protein
LLERWGGRVTWRDQYKVHPAADVFPMMSDEELEKLGQDIKANGLLDPITFTMPTDDDPDGNHINLMRFPRAVAARSTR